jgi:hypothetical protein
MALQLRNRQTTSFSLLAIHKLRVGRLQQNGPSASVDGPFLFAPPRKKFPRTRSGKLLFRPENAGGLTRDHLRLFLHHGLGVLPLQRFHVEPLEVGVTFAEVLVNALQQQHTRLHRAFRAGRQP